MTLIEHLEKEIKFIKNQIRKGKEPNMNHMDGYVMQGLEEKKDVLEDCLLKLTGKRHIYSQKQI
jgi:hypothetical protein